MLKELKVLLDKYTIQRACRECFRYCIQMMQNTLYQAQMTQIFEYGRRERLSLWRLFSLERNLNSRITLNCWTDSNTSMKSKELLDIDTCLSLYSNKRELGMSSWLPKRRKRETLKQTKEKCSRIPKWSQSISDYIRFNDKINSSEILLSEGQTRGTYSQSLGETSHSQEGKGWCCCGWGHCWPNHWRHAGHSWPSLWNIETRPSWGGILLYSREYGTEAGLLRKSRRNMPQRLLLQKLLSGYC